MPQNRILHERYALALGGVGDQDGGLAGYPRRGRQRVGQRGMIVAVDTTDEKLELAKQFGATHGYNVTGQANAAKDLYKLTGGGADYAFDCVGVGKISEMAWGVLRRGGTAVIVGISGPKDQITLNAQQVATTEKTLTGSYYGSARPQLDFPRLIGLYRSGRLKLDELITRTYSIDEAPRAFADLNEGKQGRGVIIFDTL